GFRTCVLADGWVDDGAARFLRARLLQRLRSRFDLLLESCRIGMRKPDPRIYSYALAALRAEPREV
ncbi:HYES hydrolase, partial [Callaeas wilsoni]|nr:HYES hydrolase [Callaeas wilsoni]